MKVCQYVTLHSTRLVTSSPKFVMRTVQVVGKDVGGWVLCISAWHYIHSAFLLICNELWQNIDNRRPEGWEHDFKNDKAPRRSTDNVCVVADERISKGKPNALCRSHCGCFCCLSWWQGHTMETNFLQFLGFKLAPSVRFVDLIVLKLMWIVDT